jgi:predicted membrane channel-forming protein YqfA (hemolysin III family)
MVGNRAKLLLVRDAIFSVHYRLDADYHDLAPFGYSVLSYITGLLFYAFHMPECFWPGKFDHWFASHQVSTSRYQPALGSLAVK